MTEPTYPLLAISRLRMETDGGGVTTLVAGSGCPLQCRWCINKALLEQPSEQITVEELFSRVCIDDLYFQATGGGVAFGGGEALLHVDFIRAFRKRVGTRWHLYAETALAVSEEAVRQAAQCIDGFIVDIKTLDPKVFTAYTGRDCAAGVKSNLLLLLSLVGAERIRVRVPEIPEYTTRSMQEENSRWLREQGFLYVEEFSYTIRK